MRRSVSIPLVAWSLVACTGTSPGGPGQAERASMASSEAAKPAPASDAAKPAPASDAAPSEDEPAAGPSEPSEAETAPTTTATDEPAAEPDAPVAPSKGRVATSLDQWRADVEARVSLPDVALLRVAAEHGDGKSTLWVQPITPDGTPTTFGTRMHTTTGEVDSIAAVYDGVTLWLAWRSHVGEVGEGGRGFVGLAGFEPRLVPSVPAKTLRTFELGAEQGDGRSVLRMVARPGSGEGVVVAALVGTKRCEGMFFEEEGYVDCHQLGVDVIGGDGSVQQRRRHGLEGGDPSLDDLVDVGEGVVTSFHAWRGGPMTDVSFTPYADAVGGPSACDYPPIELAWVDGGLLSICPDPEHESSPGVLRFSTLDGKPLPPSTPGGGTVSIVRMKSGCKAGRPVVRVSWKGGHLDVPAEDLEGIEARAAMVGGKCKGPALE